MAKKRSELLSGKRELRFSTNLSIFGCIELITLYRTVGNALILEIEAFTWATWNITLGSR